MNAAARMVGTEADVVFLQNEERENKGHLRRKNVTDSSGHEHAGDGRFTGSGGGNSSAATEGRTVAFGGLADPLRAGKMDAAEAIERASKVSEAETAALEAHVDSTLDSHYERWSRSYGEDVLHSEAGARAMAEFGRAVHEYGERVASKIETALAAFENLATAIDEGNGEDVDEAESAWRYAQAGLKREREWFDKMSNAAVSDAEYELDAIAEREEEDESRPAKSYRRKASFFSECDRDEGGHCKPGTGGGGAKPKPGKPAKKPVPEEQSHPGAAHGSEVKVKLTKQRAAPRNAKGKIDPIPVQTQLSKQETGRVAEAGIRAYLRDIEGIADTVALNAGKTNESIDLFGDSMAPEVKGGLCSNSVKAQQWRITFSMELGAKEQAQYDALSPDQQKAWREKRQRACLERKLDLLKKISKERGKKINPVTFTGIVNPDSTTIDIYKFSGYHQRLDWNGPVAEKAYVGSFKYEHA